MYGQIYDSNINNILKYKYNYWGIIILYKMGSKLRKLKLGYKMRSSRRKCFLCLHQTDSRKEMMISKWLNKSCLILPYRLFYIIFIKFELINMLYLLCRRHFTAFIYRYEHYKLSTQNEVP